MPTLRKGRQIMASWKGWLVSRLRAGVYALAYSGLLPAHWRRRLITQFWENMAGAIHATWGSERNDYATLGDVLWRYRPASLLDAGCGSGRLFPLYLQCGVQQVVGTDISERALEIAHKAFPSADLRHVSLMELDFQENSFDLCVCNRVLQHVPITEIREVTTRLARISRLIYVNELTDSDNLDQVFFMRQHDYGTLFGNLGLACLENGLIGRQTYFVFGHRAPAATGNLGRA
jgi:SAM-dependent methyltransferase